MSASSITLQVVFTDSSSVQTYIEPDLKTAHLQIHNHFNPFSGLMNPIYILKSAKPVTKQQIKAVLKVGMLNPYSVFRRMYQSCKLP
jgi:hypothetical protein